MIENNGTSSYCLRDVQNPVLSWPEKKMTIESVNANAVYLPNEEDSRRSWQHLRMEALRLIKHFNSNPPHAVNSTLSLNDACELISELNLQSLWQKPLKPLVLI